MDEGTKTEKSIVFYANSLWSFVFLASGSLQGQPVTSKSFWQPSVASGGF
jgi:hypothetical protein